MAEHNITRRSDGRYMVRWQAGGVRKSKYFRTRSEARQFVAKLETMDPRTLSEFTVGQWCENAVETYSRNMSLDTVHGYNSIIRNHIHGSLISQTKIEDLKPFMIQQWIDSMRKLSPKTVRNVYGCLHWCLKKAVENGYIQANPASGCVLPQKKKPERRILTPQRSEQILDAMQGQRDYSLWLFIATTGCRLSEAMGITEKDLDLKTGKYIIRRTVTVDHENDRAVIQERTKTTNAQRTGFVPESILSQISATMMENRKHRLIAGSMWENNGLIWCDDFGRPYRRSTVLGRLRSLQRKMGIPDNEIVGSHAFRHLVATALLRSNVSEAAVARQLGHFNAAYTRAQYMDAYEEESMEIRKITEQLIRH